MPVYIIAFQNFLRDFPKSMLDSSSMNCNASFDYLSRSWKLSQHFQCSIKFSFMLLFASFLSHSLLSLSSDCCCNMLLEVNKIFEPWHWKLHSVFSRSIVKKSTIIFSFLSLFLYSTSIHSYIPQKLENRDHSLLIAWWCNIKKYFRGQLIFLFNFNKYAVVIKLKCEKL